MTNNLSELTLKKGVVLVTLRDIKPNTKSSIIIPGKEDKKQVYLNDFPDHPFQAIVEIVGPGIEEQFPQGLKKGQIVYLDRAPNPETDFVNINGTIYCKIFTNIIFAVKEYEPNLTLVKGEA